MAAPLSVGLDSVSGDGGFSGVESAGRLPDDVAAAAGLDWLLTLCCDFRLTAGLLCTGVGKPEPGSNIGCNCAAWAPLSVKHKHNSDATLVT